MKISLIVEGGTEKAFLPFLRDYLAPLLQGRMPKFDMLPYHGPIPKKEKLKRVVTCLLSGNKASDHVIALTDVYTGSTPPEFENAADAKAKMRLWVGPEPRFHPHAAQYEFEAWLLPYWRTIQKLSGSKKARPAGSPENVNHQNPPAKRIQKTFELGKRRRSYNKIRDARRILSENELDEAVRHCPELKALINTILTICEAEPLR